MLAILKAQLQKLRRNPTHFLLMVGLTIVFTMMMGFQAGDKVTVYTYPEDGMDGQATEKWLELLNRSEVWHFRLTEEKKARESIVDGRAPFALKLMDRDYRIVAAVENDANIPSLDAYVRSVYEKELLYMAVEERMPGTDVRERIEAQLASPALRIQTASVETQDGFRYDTRIQALFGFSLFFSFYTIAFAVNGLLYDRRNKIWDRVILSPVSKTSMYFGHLLNSFLLGYVQLVIIFGLFRYVFDFPLGDSFLTILMIAAVYTFTTVALSLLLAGFVRTPQLMNVLTPIVAVSCAMIGGAYWPIEIVTNPILLALSKVVPITYGMEALKGVAYYAYSWSDLLQPVLIMSLIGVVCMGIGINLMERRSA